MIQGRYDEIISLPDVYEKFCDIIALYPEKFCF